MVNPKKIREWIDVVGRLDPDTVDSEILEATSIHMRNLLKAYETVIEEKKALEAKSNKFLVNRMVLRTITMTKWLQEHHPLTLSAWSTYAKTLPLLPEVAGPWACPQCSGYLMTREHLCSCDHMKPTGALGQLNEFIKAQKDALVKDLAHNPKCPKCEKPMLPALVRDDTQLYGCICDPMTLHPSGDGHSK